MKVNFTDHIFYKNPTTSLENASNLSEEFFNWSGHRITVLKDKQINLKDSSFNLPLLVLKLLASLTVIIPLALLILRTYTRSVLVPELNKAEALQKRKLSVTPGGTPLGVDSVIAPAQKSLKKSLTSEETIAVHRYLQNALDVINRKIGPPTTTISLEKAQLRQLKAILQDILDSDDVSKIASALTSEKNVELFANFPETHASHQAAVQLLYKTE